MSMRVVRRGVALLVVGVTVTVACPKDDPFVPVVTTITINPPTQAFTAIGLQDTFAATVLDQRGNVISGQAVVWGTSSGTVAQVTSGGVVSSTGVGSANITATIGSVSASAQVTVTQVPSAFLKLDGEPQSAPGGTQLPIPLKVKLQDAGGFGVPGVGVTFTATTGGGSVGTPNATTNAQGDATSTWTIGNSGPQTVTVSSTGVTSVVFTATVLAGVADTIIKNSVDGGTVPAGTAVSPAPQVLVRDAASNPVSGINVTFLATQGGGQVTGATVATNASGVATVGSWIVGTSAGQELTATADASGIGGNPIVFTATAQAPGAPTSVAVSGGNNQSGLTGYPVNIPPVVRVRDASNNPVQGVSVDFAVTAGGGSVTSASVPTDLQGFASVGWTINTGANTMTASVAGIGTPATFNATGVVSTFNIQFVPVPGSNPTATQQAAFDSAAARWSRIIIGDLTDLSNVTIGPNGCGRSEITQQTHNIDDVLIFVMLVPIDGVNGILGSAGYCALRSGSQLPAYGLMRFDTADLANMENQGILEDVILHEMAHVLGLGTLWETKGLLVGKDQPGTSFTGSQARAQFDAIGGTEFTGAKVPVEDCVAGVPLSCGGGTRNGHWREVVFQNELMTGYVDGPNPLSVVTSAQFGDLGYQVNLGESDPFTLSLPLYALRTAAGGVHLRDDIYRTSILVLDAAGRVVRVIQPN